MVLRYLQPGDTFRVRATGQLGILMKINDCRAYVKIQGEKYREGFEANGKWAEFNKFKGGFDNWAPSLEVDLIEKAAKKNSTAELEDAGIL